MSLNALLEKDSAYVMSDTLAQLYNLDLDEFCQEVCITTNAKWAHVVMEDERFLSRILEFADADGNGSTYAMWMPEGTTLMEEAPIIHINTDCIINVIAKNIKDFLVLLSFDEECSGDYFYKDTEDYEESDNHKTYCNWLVNSMGITPIPTSTSGDSAFSPVIERIMREAKEQYQLAFDTWLYNLENDTQVQVDVSDTLPQQVIGEVNHNNDYDMMAFLNMIGKPLNDPEITLMIKTLGFKQPTLNASYLNNRSIDLCNAKETFKMTFETEGDKEINLTNQPILRFVSTSMFKKFPAPFNIEKGDDYTVCAKKMGCEAQYRHKYIKESIAWVVEHNGVKKNIQIRFNNKKTLAKAKHISVSSFETENDRGYIAFQQ